MTVWPELMDAGVLGAGARPAHGGLSASNPLSEARAGALVVGVVGAVGGVGTSTFAALLADRLARRTATVLVDLDPGSAGVDILLGLEEIAGARWSDLSGARGAVDGHEVLSLLPRWGSCAVLGVDRTAPAAPAAEVVADVLRALTAVCGAVVVDLGRSVGDVECDLVLLVVPRTLTGVAGALRIRRPHARTVLVVRAGGGLGVAEVARAVGLPVAAVLRADARVRSTVEHGGLRPTRRSVRAATSVARVLERGAPW